MWLWLNIELSLHMECIITFLIYESYCCNIWHPIIYTFRTFIHYFCLYIFILIYINEMQVLMQYILLLFNVCWEMARLLTCRCKKWKYLPHSPWYAGSL
jgi:hypothetical protein